MRPLRRLALHCALVCLIWAASASLACSHPKSIHQHAGTSQAPLPSASIQGVVAGAGNAERGHELVRKYQCNRCHDGSGEAPAERNAHCVNCHRQILAGTFPATPDKLERWKPHVGYVRSVPSLVAIGARLKRDFLVRFLLEPYDLRPLLLPSMPRLGLSPTDARDIATYLTDGQDAEHAPPVAGNAVRGRALLETRGCGGCHAFSRVAALPQAPTQAQAETSEALLLAPDLAHVRERWERGSLIRWLRDPGAVKADTLMPATAFDETEASDVAAYLLETPLSAEPRSAGARRLPPLERRVTFAEVDERVLRVTCRHCHSNPDVSLGDGGPGNTGGLGFSGRAIDLSSYRGLLSGYRNAEHERRSLFERTADGTPRVVAALLARQDEEAGRPHADVRGMPLGLPALTSEQIQLLDTWVQQGRAE